MDAEETLRRLIIVSHGDGGKNWKLQSSVGLSVEVVFVVVGE